MKVGSCETTVGGSRLVLLAEKAVWVPEQNTLLVADVHLGKDATFRRNGLPVPVGSSHCTLRRLQAAIDRTRAQHLVVLGDMFHDRLSLASEVRLSWESFHRHNASLTVQLVLGNHDRSVGKLPEAWGIDVVEPIHDLGRLALAHDPTEHDVCPPGKDVLLCGHLHPAFRPRSTMESSGAIPCFWGRHRVLVLPAFGEFTGSHLITPSAEDRVWLPVEGQVLPLS